MQVEASPNGQVWTPLEGKYTDPGTSSQIFGEPVYDGFQTEWVRDELNLEEFLGGPVYIRFILRSDAYVVEDGFYWDDLQVTIIDMATGIGEPGYQTGIEVIGPSPNPASGETRFTLKGAAQQEDIRLSVFNSMGQRIFDANINGSSEYTLDTETWKNGMYYYRFTAGNMAARSGKLVIRK